MKAKQEITPTYIGEITPKPVGMTTRQVRRTPEREEAPSSGEATKTDVEGTPTHGEGTSTSGETTKSLGEEVSPHARDGRCRKHYEPS